MRTIDFGVNLIIKSIRWSFMKDLVNIPVLYKLLCKMMHAYSLLHLMVFVMLVENHNVQKSCNWNLCFGLLYGL